MFTLLVLVAMKSFFLICFPGMEHLAEHAAEALGPLKTLGPTDWLDDEHIRLIKLELHARFKSINHIFVLEPAFVELGLASAGYLHPMLPEHFSTRSDTILIPLNNAIPGTEGSHWTLLTVRNQRSEHVDSIVPGVRSSCLKAGKVNYILRMELQKWELPHLVTASVMFKQRNGYDCGIYVWLHMENAFRQRLQKPNLGEMIRQFGIERVITQRRRYLNTLIEATQRAQATLKAARAKSPHAHVALAGSVSESHTEACFAFSASCAAAADVAVDAAAVIPITASEAPQATCLN